MTVVGNRYERHLVARALRPEAALSLDPELCQRRHRVYTEEHHTGVALKSVAVREFRNNASAYLSGSQPVAVTRHGKVIGFYIPLERDEDEVRRAVAKFGSTVEKVLAESSVTEEDLAQIFDLRRPMPE